MGVEVMLKLNTSTQLDFSFPPLQSGTTARGLVPLIFRMGLWVFLPLWRHTHRHPQLCLFDDPKLNQLHRTALSPYCVRKCP